MKNLVYTVSDIFFNLLAAIIPVRKNKVLFLTKVTSGSNTTIVANRMKKKYSGLNIVEIRISKKERGWSWVKQKLEIYKHALTSRIVVTSHGSLIKTYKNVSIDLWHAFPTKKAGLMLDDTSVRRMRKTTDYFLSYSTFSTILLNSRYGMKASKYIELGSPRNDYLFDKVKGRPGFSKEFKDHKVVYYLPTFRESENEEKYLIRNLRFEDFDIERFNNFLKKNSILFVMKFHPNEEEKLWNQISTKQFSNIVLLKEEYLDEGYDDFYQILPYSDLLITDYSSIYVDYLLLNRPIIFTPTDIEEYNESRGLLLEPYDFWRPGPKCVAQDSLEEEIVNCLNDEKYYESQRDLIKEIFFEYSDGNSAERVSDFIYSKLKL